MKPQNCDSLVVPPLAQTPGQILKLLTVNVLFVFAFRHSDADKHTQTS